MLILTSINKSLSLPESGMVCGSCRCPIWGQQSIVSVPTETSPRPFLWFTHLLTNGVWLQHTLSWIFHQEGKSRVSRPMNPVALLQGRNQSVGLGNCTEPHCWGVWEERHILRDCGHQCSFSGAVLKARKPQIIPIIAVASLKVKSEMKSKTESFHRNEGQMAFCWLWWELISESSGKKEKPQAWLLHRLPKKSPG